jgi:hypothetical protein
MDLILLILGWAMGGIPLIWLGMRCEGGAVGVLLCLSGLFGWIILARVHVLPHFVKSDVTPACR